MRFWIPLIIVHALTSLGGPATGAGTAPGRDDKSVLAAGQSSPPRGTGGVLKKTREQSSFGAEEDIVHPVQVPEDVLMTLRRVERNQTCLGEDQPVADMPASWFIASEINLDGDESADLVVQANNPCLFGANVNPFWVFTNTRRGFKLVLSVSALRLDILNARTGRYRDIRAAAATSNEVLTTVFKFSGREYKAARSRREAI